MTTVLVLVVLIVAVGGAVVVLRNRSEQGIESGISSFRREMRALAPRPGDDDPSAPSPQPRPVDQDPGVHLLGDRHDPPPRIDDDRAADDHASD